MGGRRRSLLGGLADPESVQRFVAALDAADGYVCHNLPFDAHQVRVTIGYDILATGKPCRDTDLESRALHPEGAKKGSQGGHGLKSNAKIYLGHENDAEQAMLPLAKSIMPLLKATTLKGLLGQNNSLYYDLYRAYPDAMVNYALDDASWTYDLAEVFAKQTADDPQVARVVELERNVQPILIRAEQRGVQTDQDQVERFETQFMGERAVLLDKLADAGLPENALSGEGSDEALLTALQAAGVPLTEKTDTGQLSTSKMALQVFEDDFPFVGDLFEYRRVERFLNTYIGPIKGVDVLHPSFLQYGAWTGRMACRRPNMQNWPQRAGKEVRNCLRARDGHKLVITDYSTLEATLLVYYLGDPTLREELDNGLDMNAWMASQIWGGEVNDWRKDGPKAEGEQSRKTARHTLYAVIYGAGGRRITKQLNLDPGPWYADDHPAILKARANGKRWPEPGWQYDAGRSLVNKVKGSLPNYWHFTNRLKTKINDVGYVNTVYGRRNPVSRDKAYMAMSAIIQGSGADVMKLGLVAAAAATAPLGAHPLLVVHDELVNEVPERHAEECLALQNEAMVNALPLNPHLKVSGAIVDSYGED